MPWRIDFEGEVYREGDLTLGQCEKIEDLTGRSWLMIHPVKWAKDARAIVAVCAAERTGQSVDGIRDRLAKMKASDFLDLMKVTDDDEDDRPTEYADGNPPQADESSTAS